MTNELQRQDDESSVVVTSKTSRREGDLDAEEMGGCSTCRVFVGKIRVNLSRQFLYQWRDKVGFFNRIFTFMTFAFLNWIILGRLGNDLSSIQDRIGLFYQTTSFSATVPVIVAVNIFPQYRDLYYRESRDGLYDYRHFITSYLLHIFPFHLASAGFFSAWFYWAIGFYPDVGRFFIYLATVLVQHYIGELHGVICWGIFYDPAIGLAVATLVIGVSSMYAGGFLKDTKELIAPLQYTTYINHFKYSGEVVAANELVGLQFDCSGEPWAEPNCTIPGDLVLESLLPGAEQNFSMNIGIMAAMTVVYGAFALLVFMCLRRKELH